MSPSLVIVAIPAEDDRVRKVSSEKAPHLTLLYLGDEASADTQQIVQFVEHAVTLSEHGPFYLDVDHRGTLGEAEADVLFFSKRSWNLKWIRQFRGQLLQNQSVRTAFDATEQHLEASQEWLPHLTLGYPEKPAKELPPENDYPLYSVEFDRIAVWWAEDEGPEFRLEWPERPEEFDGPLAVAWADAQKAKLLHEANIRDEPVVEEAEASTIMEHGESFVAGLVHGELDLGEQFILEHYGVKGMRWGHRSAAGAGTVGLAGGSTGKAGGEPAGFKREAPVPVAPKAESKVPHGNRRKTKVDVDGGQNHPATQDALKVAEAQAKLKKSGPKALTNQELRDVATRVQLEQQAVQATRGGTSKFTRETITNQGKQAVNQLIRSKIDATINPKKNK